ncbi:MAG: PD-(D/E)XK nuclease family protein [Gemmatimonadota bacterium]
MRRAGRHRMGIQLVVSSSNTALWAACSSRFLDEIGDERGPEEYSSHLWITHRRLRDSLFALAAERGLRGWLQPPVSFFSELRNLFEIEARPIGLLTGRLLVADLAGRQARAHGIGGGEPGNPGVPAQGHMLDRMFSELLPEGVTPHQLREALARLAGDDFCRRRNAWAADTYEAFLSELQSRDRFDPRSIHTRVAERIESGHLPRALRGAGRLHIYGWTSLRSRKRLVRALAAQEAVQVLLYLTREDEASEWREMVEGTPEVVSARGTPRVVVQPVPDAQREVEWIAGRVKRLLAAQTTEPSQVAVVARSGRRDTRMIHLALRAAGVPSTARIRTALAEVPALGALLQLLGAAADNWGYRPLRHVLDSPYFGITFDLRILDHVAAGHRIQGLDAWAQAFARLRSQAAAEPGWKLEAAGVRLDHLDRDMPGFEAFRATVAPLRERRTEREWIDLTLQVLAGRWFGFRERLCRVVGDRWDIVRLDQRGVLMLEALLGEWRTLVRSEADLGVAEWHARLRRLLEANELALSTPGETGVQVLEAHQAALMPFQHVFLMHANDGVFPQAPGHAGVFSEAERRRLRELGIPLTDRRESLRRERALWRAVTQDRRVTITYRTTDAHGVPLLPSPMVPEHDPSVELPRTSGGPLSGRSAPRAEPPPPIRRAEHVRHEVRRLERLRRAGDTRPFLTSDPAQIRHAVLTAFSEELRAGGLDDVIHSYPELPSQGDGRDRLGAIRAAERPPSERPHPWNGQLRDPLVLDQLARRFGEGRVWSATQLQTYAVRPFDFLLARVLGLRELEEAEEETSPLAFGNVAHTVLERFYLRVQRDLPSTLDRRAAEIYESVVEEVFREYEADVDEWLGLPSLWAATRQQVRESVREFLARDLQEAARHGDVPVLVEHRFGGEGEAPVPIRGADVGGRNRELLLRGRIDRVDRRGAGEQAGLRVIDYKSGTTPSPGGYDDGALVQTALYMRAVETLGLGPVSEGLFRSIRKRTMTAAPLKRERLESVLSFALAIPPRVRAGLFEAVQARSAALTDWQPGIEVTRCTLRLSAAARFDTVRQEVESGAAAARSKRGMRAKGAGNA